MQIELLENCLYWEGPPWLMLLGDEWPSPHHPYMKDTALEMKKDVLLISSNLVKTESPFDMFQYSSWTKLLRVTAWILRWRDLRDRGTGCLTLAERNRAERVRIRVAQKEEFLEDLKRLKADKQLKQCSKLRSLSPFLDRKGRMLFFVLVVGSLKPTAHATENIQ